MTDVKFPQLSLHKKIPTVMKNLISVMTITKYMAIGLLVVASLLLAIILATWKNGINAEGGSAENTPLLSPPQVASAELIKPVQAKKMTPAIMPIHGQIELDFGWQQHPIYKEWRFHKGIDISGSEGQEVQAIYNGEVADIFTDGHNGVTIIIKDNIYTIYYSSLSHVFVEKGAKIHSGETIGTIGKCESENYTHLHLAIKKEDQYIDPKVVLMNK